MDADLISDGSKKPFWELYKGLTVAEDNFLFCQPFFLLQSLSTEVIISGRK